MARYIIDDLNDVAAVASTATSTIVTHATAPFLAKAGKAYAIFWSTQWWIASTSVGTSVELYDVTGAAVVDSITTKFAKDTTDILTTGVRCYIYDAAATATRSFSIRLNNNSATVANIQYSTIVVLELGANDKWVQDVSETTTTSAFADKLSLNWTPAAGDFLFFADCSYGNTTGTANLAQVRLFDQTTAYGTAGPLRHNTTAARAPWSTMVRKTLTAVAQDWDLEFGLASGTSTIACKNATILALRVADLPGTFDYAEQLARTTGTTNINAAGAGGSVRVTLTPAVTIADQYVVFWGALLDSSSATVSVGAALEENNVVIGPKGFEEPTGTTEEMPVGGMQIRTLTTTEPTYELVFGDEASVTAGITSAAVALLQISDEPEAVVTWARIEVPEGSGDHIEALVGTAGTGAVGDLVALGGAVVAITGVEGTGAAGTLAVAIFETAAITGVTATGAAGDLTATGEAVVPVTGVEAAGAAGTVVAFADAAGVIAGVEGTGTAGDLAVIGDALAPVTGVEGIGAAGDVVAFADVLLELVGTEAIGGAGTLIVEAVGETQLTSVSATGAVGDLGVVGDAIVAITGIEATGAAGDLVAFAGTVVEVTGVEATGAVGTFAFVFDMVFTLDGVEATGFAGILDAGEVVVGPGAGVAPGQRYMPLPVNMGSLMIR